MTLGFSVVRSSAPEDSLLQLEYEFRHFAQEAGFREVTGAEVSAVLVTTGGTERSIVEFAGGSKVALLFYHDSSNSLAAASEAAALLAERGTRVWLHHVSEARDVLRQAANATRAYSSLRGLQITSFGGPSEWLVYSDGKGDLLGATVRVVPLDRLVREAGSAAPEELDVRPVAAEGVDEADVRKALALLTAMKRIAGDGPLTVRCFDLLRLYGVTPCLPLALLNSRGLVAGCEGDVPSLLTMYIVSSISGRPAWMGNVTPGPEPGTIGLAHCTFPISEALNYSLTTHFESGKPLAVKAEVPEGRRATLAKYDPRTRTLRAIRATVRSGRQFTRACRTQAVFSVSQEAVRLTLSRPMGAHYVAVLDDIVPGLRVFSALAGINLEEA